jgi:hypothetical protein
LAQVQTKDCRHEAGDEAKAMLLESQIAPNHLCNWFSYKLAKALTSVDVLGCGSFRRPVAASHRSLAGINGGIGAHVSTSRVPLLSDELLLVKKL